MADETSQAVAKEEKTYHHGDLRRKLVTVIQGLIEEHGPDGFSVAEAARRAGVSSAAPYKHFKDRADILHAIVSDAMDRLSADMLTHRAKHAPGGPESVAAIGLAYIEFALREPGVFRVMFSLTEGQEGYPDILAKGQDTFGIVRQTVGDYLGPTATEAQINHCAYLLWTIVHGHAFLEIDAKSTDVIGELDLWAFLMDAGYRVLGPPRDTAP